MVKFRQLFSFQQKEIDAAFKNSKPKGSIAGLKLLISQPSSKPQHGKLLIITPKASGKANQRNLLRRRIKSIYYEEKLYTKPIIAILLVYKEAPKLSFEELKNFLSKNLK
jgi:ribonuclease P protein component